jgi:hypothetical protein
MLVRWHHDELPREPGLQQPQGRVGIFIVVTIFMAYQASHLRIDAGFAKLLPLEHEYMQTYLEYREQFGGANRVVIAIRAKEGDIFHPNFFRVLSDLTDDVFFISGVDRTRVMSLFTPNVRFTEVVEDGIAGGNVIPADFEPTPEGFAEFDPTSSSRTTWAAWWRTTSARPSWSPSCSRSTRTPARSSTTSTSRRSWRAFAPSTAATTSASTSTTTSSASPKSSATSPPAPRGWCSSFSSPS